MPDVHLQPLPGVSAKAALEPVDKAIVMGAAADGNALRAAAEAHRKAIGSIGVSGVASAADYEAVNAALGRVVASVPTPGSWMSATPAQRSSLQACPVSAL